ncbi:MAG: DNA-binding protein [Candidatus Electrothrix sp. YB6]
MVMRSGYIAGALALALMFAGPVSAEEKKTAPAAREAAAGLAGKPIQGKVLEVQSGGGYTYLQIKGEQDAVWVAIPETPVEAGQEVVVSPGMLMKSFESESLGRTFDALIFSAGLEEPGKVAQKNETEGGTPDMSKHHEYMQKVEGPVDDAELERLSGGSKKAAVPADKISVDKAEGDNAQTVEECFANVEKLDGKTVRVRGKVVKFSPMIMGKNWLHLQDGTGDAEKKTHDLVVTTSETTEKGAVVTIEGTLHKEKDFGAGYRYDAIVEDAKIVGE